MVITKEDIQTRLPSRKNTVTDEVVDIINRAATEPEFQGESLLQTAAIYENVMIRNKASIKDYLNAIRFCAYLITMDDNYTEAYKKVFGDRDFVKERMHLPTDDPRYKELTSAASRYRNTSKLVTEILTLSQAPLDLMFMGARYKAIGVLADIMENGRFDRDKINAAKELLAATKGAEKMQLDIGVGTTDKAINLQEQLNQQIAQLVANQQLMLQTGANIDEVQKVGININYIEADVEEVTDAQN